MNSEYVYYCTLRTFGVDEEKFNKLISSVTCDGIELKFSEVNLVGKIVVGKKNVDNIALVNVLKQLYQTIGKYIYADTDIEINECLVKVLIENGVKISVAESITGGMIASEICGVDNASLVFYEGLVTYNSGAKLRRLHVPAKTIEDETSVSANTTIAMLKGLLANKEISYGIATTGYATGKESGLAFVAFGSTELNVVEEVNFSGERNEVRAKVANYAMFKLLTLINKNELRY